MRKLLLTLGWVFLSLNLSFSQANLIISEVTDPADDFNGRFVELYNAGTEAVDFSTVTIFLSRQSNGSTTWGDVQLVGTVAAGETFVIGASTFQGLYGFAPDQVSTILTGNGDDGYFLYSGGNHSTGILHDAYGVVNQDGTGFPWEYLDARAERVFGTTLPTATWTASEWVITAPANLADCNPGFFGIVVDTDPPVWANGYPKAANILETGFDIAVKLDETSTVYYVVLESGATAPSVSEVLAGTGAAGAAAVLAGNFSAGGTEVTESLTGLTTDQAYTVYLVAQDDESTPNVQADVVSFDATPVTPPSVLYYADFATSLNPFAQLSETGDTKTWIWVTDHAEMNGFNSGEAEKDWFISPDIDLTDITSASLEFRAHYKYGTIDATHHLKLYYSADYDGNLANVLTSTWTELPFTSPDIDTWTTIGVDISSLTGVIYVAFVYDYPDNYSRWSIDECKVLGYAPAGTDATLSELLVDGMAIAGFDPAKTDYIVKLPAGTTTVPVVSYTTNDENASAVLTDATDLGGDAAARTTTIEVTAQDGLTVSTYSVLFNPVLEVATVADLRSGDKSREFILNAEVLLTYKNSSRNQKFIQDATGGVMIDDSPGIITTSYAIGDKITGIQGTLLEYNGLLEFVPTADPGAPVSSGNDVVAEVITVDQLNTQLATFEGKFVKVEGVSMADAGAVFASKVNYNFSDGTHTAVLRTNYSDLDYIGNTIPAMTDLSGVVIQYKGTAQIVPRFASDIVEFSSDATLSDILINGVSLEGFVPATTSYDVLLAPGTTEVPEVTYTTSNANASAVVTDATDLHGDEAARTTTIDVSAQDGTAMTYTLVFTVDNTSVQNLNQVRLSVYPVPATSELIVKGLGQTESFDIVNILGTRVKTVQVNADQMRVEISDLDPGIYMIRSTGTTIRFIKK